jgi:histidyl-tRNA synthetase
MNFEILKGTQDFEPSRQIQIESIFSLMRAEFERFGFRPFDTPIIEYLETLTHKYDADAEIVGEIFKVKDRGDRALGLRYDLTTPLCRFVAMHRDLKKPFRRYHIGKVFRDGPIKKGRMREFYQCDCDVVGVSGVSIEAELLELFYSVYKQLNLDVVIELNNNKILQGALLQQGCNADEVEACVLCIDKLKKIGKDGVLAEVKEKGFDVTLVSKAIDILTCKSFAEIEKTATHELLKQGILELKQLAGLIEGTVNYRLNFSMSRGLAIYTGNIWESYDVQARIPSSLGAGGRYDNVIGEYRDANEQIPAVGISFGLEPIMALYESKRVCEGVTSTLIAPLDEAFVLPCLKLARLLRSKGKNVELFYGYKLPKAMDYAKYLGCEEIIVIGKRDLDAKECKVKNLISGAEEVLKL